MKQNKTTKIILIILLRLISVLTLIYFAMQYYDLKYIIENVKPVGYSIISTEEINRPKSHFALMQINFKEKKYKVEVPIKDYYKSINKKEQPELYYYKKRDIVFSKMLLNQYKAWSIVSGIVLLVSFIPFEKISKKMDEDIKRKTDHTSGI